MDRNAEYALQAAIHAIQRMVAFTKEERFAETPIEGIEVRQEALADAWAQTKAAERQLSSAKDPLMMAEVERKMAEAEESYFLASAALKRKRIDLQPQEKERQEPQIAVQVSMPFSQHDVKNTWGEFDGTITKWQGFRDRFLAAVHDNDRIEPAYKFAYLKKSLVGKAARALGEWQLTGKNYIEAWNRINEMYHRQYATCRELLRQFFKLPILQGLATANELQRMVNVTHETLRQLKAQDIPVDGWDMIIVHVLHERMDGETACKWEEARSSEFPTVKEVCAFLEKRAIALGSAQDCRRRDPSRPSTSAQAIAMERQRERTDRQSERRINRQPERATERQQDRRSLSSRFGRTDESRKKPCQACFSMTHPLWDCPEFQALTLQARQNLVRDRNICPNCLKNGHSAKECFQGPCTRCPGRRMHNSMLCPIKEMGKEDLMVLRVQEQGKKRSGQTSGRKQKSD
ncbi:uncharacterized protein LOC129919896 isoform X2 [Episyrphus balteatus]|nr:uncharacterized protein LOC129919896 isoform X2 [Episyrphus balteatus]